MPANYPDKRAHDTFPITAPALQRSSLKPDFNYYETTHARTLSAQLSDSPSSFSAAELAAIGLMGKAYLAVIQNYLDSAHITYDDLDRFYQDQMGLASAHSAVVEVVGQFPPALAYAFPEQARDFGFNKDSSIASRHSYYYSLLLILVAENNSAFKSRDGFFTSPSLRKSRLFKDLIFYLRDFFSSQSAISPGEGSLVDFLLEPAQRYPDSIFDQLVFISRRWSHILSPYLLQSILINLDRIKEENKFSAPTKGKAENPLGHLASTALQENDLVRFSPDQDWMPRVILQAKNVFVWLYQLSREYGSPIQTLDQIPAEELRKISQRGINALWLIGLWERSQASQQIKKICGNPEAVSSAYSLYDYRIAESLGGENSYQLLAETASKFNLRLAADMVPNHVGIDSLWVKDHPDWFLYLDSPPYPGYTFNGVDLSTHPSISIYLEDHYYDKSDASVVFKRLDQGSGDVRYIYHGNDGTSMPWNDTAQLDFLNPTVREAVIQTILHVARKFPIIRFDAAMTLSKKHYQRLWFPQPGTGGAIPTRADFSLSKSQFNARMPEEFWREVVDRVSQEAPDTLLLAEAFWMMEGYFVRSLGMHRVYNSAFMHMLRDEENKEYRKLMLDTLEYDPQILKRYVNFMNNPDEDTALAQFGSGGKYFGTCIMMATLPGLPMFGHGQIEGFSEKYGMEYQKAYYDEVPDPNFIERHQSEVFPLLHKRYLFADVNNFHLYDFVTHDGGINEDVFAYSNRFGNEKALILYHNKWGETQGHISRSVSVHGKAIDLLSGLGLNPSSGDYLIFKDLITGLHYLHSLREISSHGLAIKLGAYCYHAFIDFEVVQDQDGSYSLLAQALNGSGVPDLQERRMEMIFTPLAESIASLVSAWLNESTFPASDHAGSLPYPDPERVLGSSLAAGKAFFDNLAALFPERAIDCGNLYLSFQQRLSALLGLSSCSPASHSFIDPALLPWSVLADLPLVLDSEDLRRIIAATSKALENHHPFWPMGQESLERILTVMVSIYPRVWDTPLALAALSELWLSNPETRNFIELHDFEGHTWFHKEPMETLIRLTYSLIAFHFCLENAPDFSLPPEEERELTAQLSRALTTLESSKYRADLFTDLVSRYHPGEQATP